MDSVALSPRAPASGAPLQPADMSLFDPLAVQVELRHPDKLRCQDSFMAGAEGGEEDVTPTGTQATPSPSGGVGLPRSGSPVTAALGGTSPRGGASLLGGTSLAGGASPTPPFEGMQSLGRLSLAVKELPEEEALLLLQGDEDASKVATVSSEMRGLGVPFRNHSLSSSCCCIFSHCTSCYICAGKLQSQSF